MTRDEWRATLAHAQAALRGRMYRYSGTWMRPDTIERKALELGKVLQHRQEAYPLHEKAVAAERRRLENRAKRRELVREKWRTLQLLMALGGEP